MAERTQFLIKSTFGIRTLYDPKKVADKVNFLLRVKEQFNEIEFSVWQRKNDKEAWQQIKDVYAIS